MSASRRIAAALAMGLATMALAGCGDDSGDASPGAQAPTTAGDAATSDATVQLAETTLGEVMVNTDGRTLYLFTKDSGTTTACTGGCAQTWPALQAAGEPTAGKGVDASKLATASGQVAYGGRLLYLYSGDKAKGDVNGQGIGGVWFVVGPDGEPVKATPTTSGTSY